MAIKRNSKLISTRKAIRHFLDDMSEGAFDYWVERGMPVRFVNGRWLGHEDNLNRFFQEITKKGEGRIPEEAKI